MSAGASVSHRLFLLVACQTAIALMLVLTGLHAIYRMSADYRHMVEFQLQSIYAIRLAREEAATLKDGFQSEKLDAFYKRYRTQWDVASANNPDAIRFREDLSRAKETTLPRQESELLGKLKKSLEMGDIEGVRENLASLYDLNIKYAVLSNRFVMERMKNSRAWLFGLGLAGIALTLFLGLHMRRAIGPRIQRLVGYVRRFQNGVYEQISESGNDDISVLTNALNAGFGAIALRERDHERFLAVAAHELKTPVTSIHGYASLLVTHPAQVPHVFRALEIINRQSWRLNRLIETLFLALKARTRELRFEPKPLDLSALLRRVLQEMEPFLSTKVLARIDGSIAILGDESLLEHALWSLFTCAARLSARDTPLHISLYTVDHRACLAVDIEKSDIPIPEVQELFMPLQSMEYETGTGIRSAVGLYLCREIIRIHNGHLQVQQVSDKHPEFLVELPT